MAITYKKALKTVVFTLHDGSTITAADTAKTAIGSEALAMYETGGLIVVQGTDSITKFYADAVVKAVISVAQSDEITKAEPYCAEEAGEADSDSGN